jgi:alpha-amylase
VCMSSFLPPEALASIDSSDKDNLRINFDNASDKDITVVTIEGSDQTNLLVTLSGAFGSAGIDVLSASINSDEGRVTDVFKVQMEGKKVTDG